MVTSNMISSTKPAVKNYQRIVKSTYIDDTLGPIEKIGFYKKRYKGES